MTANLAWDADGLDWPHRDASRFVSDGGVRWHVQIAGAGPPALLLHGTGASTHSWRGLLPLLWENFTVIAPDLPGHGFTGWPEADGFSLPGMASAVSGLLRKLGMRPALAIGHSAGAAVALRMALDGAIEPRGVSSLNGALLPFNAVAAPLFSGLARLLVSNPLVPWAFAAHAGSGRTVERLLDDTGSRIDAAGVTLYRRLAGNSQHVAAALRMMANWDLARLQDDLPRLKTPLQLLAGTRDRTISPEQAFEVRKLVPKAEIVRLNGLGHLAHEEQPGLVADHIHEFARRGSAAMEG